MQYTVLPTCVDIPNYSFIPVYFRHICSKHYSLSDWEPVKQLNNVLCYNDLNFMYCGWLLFSIISNAITTKIQIHTGKRKKSF